MGLMSKMGLFSRRAQPAAEPTPVADTEFGAPSDTGEMEFQHVQAGAAPAVEEPAPLRLGSAMGGAKQVTVDDIALEFRLPLIGHLTLARQLRILLVLFGFGIVFTGVAAWFSAASSAVASAQTQVASDALMHSQRIGKAAPNALQGNLESFKQLDESRAALTNDLVLLIRGGPYGKRMIPAAPLTMNLLLTAARKKWSLSDNAANNILNLKPEIIGFDATLKKLDAMSPDLLAMAEDLSTQKLARGGTAREMAAIGQLMMLTQRLSRSASEFLISGVIRGETAFQMGRDTTTFRTMVDALENGNAAFSLPGIRDRDLHDKLELLRARFDQYQQLVNTVLKNLKQYTAAKAAEQSIFDENEDVRTLLSNLQRTYRAGQDSTDFWFWVMAFGGVGTLLTALMISRVLLQDSRIRAIGAEQRRHEAESQRLLAQSKEEEAKATNDQNQAAILRLMNELQEVADGDLTVHATVSEDITGAIADSVNYTVEELRALVERVTRTAEQVTSASTDAQTVSSDLLTATEQQSREIQDASATVLKMANEITDVSRSANESAEVARQSLAAARQGSTAVENAIKGMHEIREQIQETSKRIKRLGESSQEIGEITELISDITEQTNVLALNAAIQAASAGEAGRGFSVVAEEVQRLAERSAEATKQIGALVRTIQADTHDAVAAMEKSTQGVVEGAKLSDAAGAALSDISRVSNRLAELIQGISFATGLQATSANGVALNIQHILSVTEHTQDGTEQTAQSIRQLGALAQELKNSVSRFRVVAEA
jgi:twitching motility protein PilJ